MRWHDDHAMVGMMSDQEDEKKMNVMGLMMVRSCLAILLGWGVAGNALAGINSDVNGSLYGRVSVTDTSSFVSGGGQEAVGVVPVLLAEGKTGTHSTFSGSQGIAAQGVDVRSARFILKPGRASIDFSWVPRPGPWMTVLAGIGFVGMLIGRAKRRYY